MVNLVDGKNRGSGVIDRWRQPLRCDIYKNPKHEGRVLLHGSFVADAYRLPQSIHVERALELGVADADAVRLILEHRWEQPVGLFCLDGRPHLQVVAVPAPDLSVYASLTAGVAM